MPKCVLGERIELHLVDEFRSDQGCYVGVVDHEDRSRRRIGIRSTPRRSAFVWRRVRGGRCGRRWWRAGSPAHDLVDVTVQRVATRITVDDAALGEVTHDLLGEERVAPGPFGDPGRQVVDQRMVPTSSVVSEWFANR